MSRTLHGFGRSSHQYYRMQIIVCSLVQIILVSSILQCLENPESKWNKEIEYTKASEVIEYKPIVTFYQTIRQDKEVF